MITETDKIKISNYLEKNQLFNIFGLVAIAPLRASLNVSPTDKLNPKVTDEEIKDAIKQRFGHEITGEITFK